MIAFNTHRTYTEHGQRIAAQRLESGAIVMLDIDRGIDYVLPASTEFTQRGVMSAYDHNRVIYPTDIGLSYEDYYAILKTLSAAAGAVTSV
jgi:hypothetical protein